MEDAVEILDSNINREESIYMEEKNMKFYPWFVAVKATIKNKDKFIEHIKNGIGRSKRLGFGMIVM